VVSLNTGTGIVNDETQTIQLFVGCLDVVEVNLPYIIESSLSVIIGSIKPLHGTSKSLPDMSIHTFASGYCEAARASAFSKCSSSRGVQHGGAAGQAAAA
jgi:hypothetical protein